MLEARAFEPEFLGRLDRLALGIKRARTARVGQRTLGRIHGLGIEVENFKTYAEGDDLRFLDWNAFARLDDLLLRTYRATRQVEVTVLVDASASMAVPRADDKLGFALLLGAALAYLGIGENDAVRMVSFAMHRGKLRLDRSAVYSRREMYPQLKPFINAIRPEGSTRLAAMAEQLLSERRPAGLMILLSDFLVDPSDYEDALTRLTIARHELKVVHVMGERESSGQFGDHVMRVRDSESGEVRELALGEDAGERYRRRVEELAARLRDFCTRRGITYVRAFGAPNLDHILTSEFPRLGLVV
ncbi:MAG TPA: DUF58 domain-containing protein [Candidatus Binataceae bacterium]|nr:DUF58 domain-containing protein [Candidatus Binataceae bacterium]